MNEPDHNLVISAYELAVAQLVRQAEDLKHFRNQASISGAINGVVAAALATLASASDEFSFDCLSFCHFGVPLPHFAGLSFLFLSVLFAVATVVSWRPIVSNLDPELFLYDFENPEEGKTSNAMLDLTRVATTNFDKNELTIADAQVKLGASLMMGLLQIPCWIIAII